MQKTIKIEEEIPSDRIEKQKWNRRAFAVKNNNSQKIGFVSSTWLFREDFYTLR